MIAVAQPTATTMGWHADIILLDVDLTGSIRFCMATSRGPNETRVIMLSHTSEPPRIVAAIEAGARAWVRKDESVEHLLRVLRGVDPGRDLAAARGDGQRAFAAAEAAGRARG